MQYIAVPCLFLSGTIYATPNSGEPVKETKKFTVELSEFTHISSEEVTTFEWETISELNFSHFVLESSRDLQVWESSNVILSNKAIEGGQYSVMKPTVDQHYFVRLKMIFENGDHSYSEHRLVTGSFVDKVEMRKNTVPHILDLGVENITEIQIENKEGVTFPVEVLNKKQIDLKSLRAGFYLIKIRKADGTVETKKYLKL